MWPQLLICYKKWEFIPNSPTPHHFFVSQPYGQWGYEVCSPTFMIELRKYSLLHIVVSFTPNSQMTYQLLHFPFTIPPLKFWLAHIPMAMRGRRCLNSTFMSDLKNLWSTHKDLHAYMYLLDKVIPFSLLHLLFLRLVARWSWSCIDEGDFCFTFKMQGMPNSL